MTLSYSLEQEVPWNSTFNGYYRLLLELTMIFKCWYLWWYHHSMD